eukprot:s8604_g2.t1
MPTVFPEAVELPNGPLRVSQLALLQEGYAAGRAWLRAELRAQLRAELRQTTRWPSPISEGGGAEDGRRRCHRTRGGIPSGFSFCLGAASGAAGSSVSGVPGVPGVLGVLGVSGDSGVCGPYAGVAGGGAGGHAGHVVIGDDLEGQAPPRRLFLSTEDPAWRSFTNSRRSRWQLYLLKAARWRTFGLQYAAHVKAGCCWQHGPQLTIFGGKVVSEGVHELPGVSGRSTRRQRASHCALSGGFGGSVASPKNALQRLEKHLKGPALS